MNCQDTQRLMGVRREADWPAEALAHVDGCAECRAAAERERGLARLWTVARAERPDAGFDARLRARIHAGLKATPEAPFWALPAPRYGLAAAALVMVAVLPLYLSGLPAEDPALDAVVGQATDYARPPEPPPMLAAPAPRDVLPFRMAEGLIPVLRLQEYADLAPGALTGTNGVDRIGPAGIRYGGGESTTVDFTY
jgi:hypothetical protein